MIDERLVNWTLIGLIVILFIVAFGADQGASWQNSNPKIKESNNLLQMVECEIGDNQKVVRCKLTY